MVQQEAHQGISRSLNIHGWGHLDPVLLAALATESPLLLVGPHGTAKSLLVERIATILGLSLRHYNASLLNYDDLVGIPLPESDGESLRFVSTPSSIWDAQFVFFDEISRCRPDLQNKLFPIIHERRVTGIRLNNLRHRWAAMNPPAPDDPDTNAQPGEYYLGSEPLDPALADRFPFIVTVPGWRGLSKDDRRRLVAYEDDFAAAQPAAPTPEGALKLNRLIEDCAARIQGLETKLEIWLADYIVHVVDLLEKAQLPQSPRRARMLARSVAAVHAARQVLEDDDVDLEFSAELALTFGLPQNAFEVPPSQATVVAAHKQAWEIANLIEGDTWRQVLEEFDPVRRVLLADQLNFADSDISRLITQALSVEPSDARRVGLATVMFLAFHQQRNLEPSAWEPLAQFAARVLEPRTITTAIRPGLDMNTWQEIQDWLETRPEQDGMLAWLERNYVLSGFPELWRRHKWPESVERFRSDLMLFNVVETSI